MRSSWVLEAMSYGQTTLWLGQVLRLSFLGVVIEQNACGVFFGGSQGKKGAASSYQEQGGLCWKGWTVPGYLPTDKLKGSVSFQLHSVSKTVSSVLTLTLKLSLRELLTINREELRIGFITFCLLSSENHRSFRNYLLLSDVCRNNF